MAIDFLINNISRKLSGNVSLFILVIIEASFFYYFSKFTSPKLNASALDAEFGGYTYDQVYERMKAFGEDGRKVYITYVTPVDLVFSCFYPIVFSAAFVRLFGWKRNSIVTQFIHIAPFCFFLTMKVLGGFCDFCENLFLFTFAYTYPTRLPLWAISVASTFTIVKYIFFFSSLAFVFLGLLKKLFFAGQKSTKKTK